jgi:hypothetical protein
MSTLIFLNLWAIFRDSELEVRTLISRLHILTFSEYIECPLE